MTHEASKVYWGGNQGHTKVVCQQLCQGNASCTCWTKQGQTCYLFGGQESEPSWDTYGSQSGVTSGPRECYAEPGWYGCVANLASQFLGHVGIVSIETWYCNYSKFQSDWTYTNLIRVSLYPHTVILWYTFD